MLLWSLRYSGTRRQPHAERAGKSSVNIASGNQSVHFSPLTLTILKLIINFNNVLEGAFDAKAFDRVSGRYHSSRG
jgi:hypothetical protein